MATKKITELVEITTAASDDVLPIVDVIQDITNKITTTNLLKGKQDLLESGTNIKTINSNSLLGSGDVSVQETLVSGTNIKTINSTSLLGSGDISISANPSGGAGSIQFSDGSAFASDSNLFWDNTNKRLGVGTNTPTATLQVIGSGSTSATTSLLVQNSSGTNIASFKDNGELNLILDRSGNGLNLIDNLAITQSSKYYQKGGVAQVTTSGTPNLKYFYWGNDVAYPNGLFAYDLNSFIISDTQKNLVTAKENSAVLQADSTAKGFLPPRMTTTQKNAISSPASGLVVYDTDTNKLCCYNGTSWNDLF